MKGAGGKIGKSLSRTCGSGGGSSAQWEVCVGVMFADLPRHFP